MTDSRRSVLVGPSLPAKYPKFVARLGRENRITIVGVGELNTLAQSYPWNPIADLMLVDRSSLLLATTWLDALSLLGADPPPVVVVQDDPQVALRVVAAHSGAAGVIDPLADWGTIAVALDHVSSTRTSLDRAHPIWDAVEHPVDPK